MPSVIKCNVTKDDFKKESNTQSIYRGDIENCKRILLYNYNVARIIFPATYTDTEVLIDYEKYILKYTIK